MNHKKLFIPGPTEVRPEILQAMATPQIGHRSKEFQNLYTTIYPKLQDFLYTKGQVFLFTSSSTGAMEAAVRNTVAKRCLSCMCGAFSDRWHTMATSNGIEADPLQVEWGKASKPEMIDEKLKTGKYDAITFVFNETSTGVMNPLYDVAEVMKKYPDVMFLVDAVSAMAGVKIEVDKLGIDVCLAGVQKAFALPAGLTICTASEKALKKAADVKNRGYYFDFLTMLKYHEKNQTTTTPTIPHIFALNAQMDDIAKEGYDNRFERHRKMAKIVQDWAKEYFDLFAEPGYESLTLTCVKNTRGISVADLNKELGKHWITISNGYGKLKEQTFRIAHMGDAQVSDIMGLLELINSILGL
ncbi:aminotransferase [bacterium (candidate division B38) B3_B38]|nr:MAG: aminotransferase [bacterium (candidate division B38) B3_B38]